MRSTGLDNLVIITLDCVENCFYIYAEIGVMTVSLSKLNATKLNAIREHEGMFHERDRETHTVAEGRPNYSDRIIMHESRKWPVHGPVECKGTYAEAANKVDASPVAGLAESRT